MQPCSPGQGQTVELRAWPARCTQATRVHGRGVLRWGARMQGTVEQRLWPPRETWAGMREEWDH
jgi:hypothetical protein